MIEVTSQEIKVKHHLKALSIDEAYFLLCLGDKVEINGRQYTYDDVIKLMSIKVKEQCSISPKVIKMELANISDSIPIHQVFRF